MAHFKMKKPNYSYQEWIKYFFLRALVLPTVWDIAQITSNFLLGRLVGKYALPAQENDEYRNLTFEKKEPELISYTHHTIQTYDGAVLDTIEMNHNDTLKIDKSKQTYIVNFVSNAMCYELISGNMHEDCLELKCNVIGFNYRGVGKSTGQTRSAKNLIIDGISQVERLLEEGVVPNHIYLKGISLGGAIATQVAWHFHKLGKPVYLFNGFSSSTFTNILVGHIRLSPGNHYIPRTGHQEFLLGQILGTFAKPTIWFWANLLGWEVDAGSAFKKIPKEYREYVVARSAKINGKRRYDALDDVIITHFGSLHECLDKKEHDKNPDRKMSIKTTNYINKLGEEKVYDYRQNAHNAPFDLLENRNGVNTVKFFIGFVKKQQDTESKIEVKGLEI